MQIAGLAAAGANRQTAGHRGLGPGGEGGSLLVAHMHPLDLSQTAEAVLRPFKLSPVMPQMRSTPGIGQCVRSQIGDRSIRHVILTIQELMLSQKTCGHS